MKLCFILLLVLHAAALLARAAETYDYEEVDLAGLPGPSYADCIK